MILSNETDLQLEVKHVNWLGMMFVRCYCFVMIPLGIIGHSLSIFVFTRRSLRTNPCVMYLLAATIFGLLTSSFNVPMRLIQAGYVGLDPTAHSIIMCKIVWFLLYSIRLLSYWFVVLACIDRYLCSSPSANKRAWSSTRVAYRAIPLTVLVGFLIYIPITINFKIYIVPTTHKPVCHGAGPPGSYRKFLSLLNLIIFGLGPPLCMLIFGILTLRHTYRRKGFHIIPLTHSKIPKMKTTERQLLRMLVGQVLVYSVTGLMFSIVLIIAAMNRNRQKSALEVAHEGLIIVIVGVFSNTGPSLSFYLFTLSSRQFRRELNKLFHRLVTNETQLTKESTSTNEKDLTTKDELE